MREAPSFWVRQESTDGVIRLFLGGELDMGSVPALEEAFEEAERSDGETIVVDLSALTFVDSSGLHAFLSAHRRATLLGRSWALANAHERVRALLRLTRCEHLLVRAEPALDEEAQHG